MAVMYIEDAANHIGGEVTIRGWLRHRRDKGNCISSPSVMERVICRPS